MHAPQSNAPCAAGVLATAARPADVPGDIRLAHFTDEYVSLAEVEDPKIQANILESLEELKFYRKNVMTI